MAGNIGMMNEAYFLSKAVLLEWVNTFAQANVEKVEHMATGACYCNLFDGLHPKTIPMSKVDFSVKYDYEYAKNWKLLQNAFQKVGIKKQIPVERLTKARYQDNLEFLQWFYKYAHDSYPGDCDNPDYDAISARNRSKGSRDFGNNNNNNARLRNNIKISRGKENMLGNHRPPSARSHSNYQNNKYNNNNNNNNNGMNNTSNSQNNNNNGSMRGYRGQNNNRRGNSRNDNNNNNNNGMGNGSINDGLEDTGLIRELETLREENNKLLGNNDALQKQLSSATNAHDDLRNVAKDIEKERDFYFNKVLEIETICKEHNDQSLPVLTKIYNILYATDDGESNNNVNSSDGNVNINGNEDASVSMNVNGSDINSVDNSMPDKNAIINQDNGQFIPPNNNENQVIMQQDVNMNANNIMQM